MLSFWLTMICGLADVTSVPKDVSSASKSVILILYPRESHAFACGVKIVSILQASHSDDKQAYLAYQDSLKVNWDD